MTTEPARNLPMAYMAAGLTVVCAVVCLFSALAGGLWWFLFAAAAILGLVALYGLGESLQKVPRNAKGDPL